MILQVRADAVLRVRTTFVPLPPGGGERDGEGKGGGRGDEDERLLAREGRLLTRELRLAQARREPF